MVQEEMPPAERRRRSRSAARSRGAGGGSSPSGSCPGPDLNLAGNGRTGLWDRDEPRYAVCVREMRARGDWLFPTFNGAPRYHKPILIYWLMGLGTALGGDNPFGVRLVSSRRRRGHGAGRLVAGPADVRTAGRPAGRPDLGDGADRDRRIEAGDDRRDPGALALRMPGVSVGARPAAVATRGRPVLGLA